jgi:hypothetical protein
MGRDLVRRQPNLGDLLLDLGPDERPDEAIGDDQGDDDQRPRRRRWRWQRGSWRAPRAS